MIINLKLYMLMIISPLFFFLVYFPHIFWRFLDLALSLKKNSNHETSSTDKKLLNIVFSFKN